MSWLVTLDQGSNYDYEDERPTRTVGTYPCRDLALVAVGEVVAGYRSLDDLSAPEISEVDGVTELVFETDEGCGWIATEIREEV